MEFCPSDVSHWFVRQAFLLEPEINVDQGVSKPKFIEQ